MHLRANGLHARLHGTASAHPKTPSEVLATLLLRPAATVALLLAACAPGDRTRAEAAQDTARAEAEPPPVPPLQTDSAGQA